MSSNIRTVSPTGTLRELGKLIEQFDYNAFPVLESERLHGIVTKFDFPRAGQYMWRYSTIRARRVRTWKPQRFENWRVRKVTAAIQAQTASYCLPELQNSVSSR